MFLSKKNISFFLFEKGIIDWETFNTKKPIIREKCIRNLCFTFKIKNSPQLFIKQLKFNDTANKNVFEKEADFYKIVASNPNFNKLRAFIPKLYHYCQYNNVLTLEYISNSFNYLELLSKNHNNIDQITNFTHLLKILHKIEIKPSTGIGKPWIFAIKHQNTIEEMGRRSTETAKILNLLLKKEEIINGINEVAKHWKYNALIHCDLKFENIICKKRRNSNKLDFWLIDWESVTIGDSLWDIAGLLQSVIFHFVLTRKYVIIIGFLPVHPIFDNQPLIDSLKSIIIAYSQEWDTEKSVRVIQFIGCMILQRLVEMSEKSTFGVIGDEFIYIATDMIVNTNKYFQLFGK